MLQLNWPWATHTRSLTCSLSSLSIEIPTEVCTSCCNKCKLLWISQCGRGQHALNGKGFVQISKAWISKGTLDKIHCNSDISPTNVGRSSRVIQLISRVPKVTQSHYLSLTRYFVHMLASEHWLDCHW